MSGLEYTAADVGDVLGRLASVTSSHTFPAETKLLDGAGIQQHWAVLQPAAGGADLSPAQQASLQAIYNNVATIIVSCEPESFDAYEVCFEVLTKLGCVFSGPSGKEELLTMLRNVNEVYDVLLSCVETYEWVQPGATRLLRLWMLEVIFACIGFDAIDGKALMDLTDNDVSGAVSLIAFMLGCSSAPFEIQDVAGRCLVELTTADSVFMPTDASSADWQGLAIAKLTGMLNRHVNELIRAIIQFDVVESFGRCICQHQLSHERTDIIVRHFLTTIHNSLLYCSENQKKLRQHLATQSTIVQDILFPYVQNIIPALYDMPNPGPSCIEWQNLKACLQTSVVVTFNINVFRPQLCQSDLIPSVLKVPQILTHLPMLELLIKLSINVDFTQSPHKDLIVSSLQSGFDALSEEQQQRLRRRLTSDGCMRVPYSRSRSAAVDALAFVVTPFTPGAPAAPRPKKNQRRVKKKQWKKKKLFALQHAKKGKRSAAPAEPEEAEEDEDEDEDDEMPPLMEAGIPEKALCELSGGLMVDPMQTPDGHYFDRPALEDWFIGSATNPITGTPLTIAECAAATELQAIIQGYQFQMLSACEIAPEAFEPPPEPEVAAAPAEPAASLLGNLPSLQPTAPKKKKEKGKIRIESRSVVDCPDDMRCAIDGKVMVSPLKSPYGHFFEKKTLERWIASVGSVCPITGKALRLDECQPDSEMKKRIVKFLKGQ